MRRSAVLLLACLYTSGSGSEDAEQKQLRIALHAQAAPSADRIVGSVMTTNGLKRALLRTGSVEHAASLYPFHYEKLESAAWDVLIIEGWFEVISVLIHEFRRKRPGAIVLFWCLDPAFPGLDAIVSIDVDGYLTNSKPVAEALGAFAPTRLVLLAADMDEMSAAPGPAPAGAAAADGAASRRKLVYVGSALGIETKTNLVPMLREAAASPAGLELWGSGWGAVGPADLAVHWRGVLPGALLAKTYAGALAVLGATMDGQRDAGMLNNRVFEALATGAPLIQEHFPELETLFATDANSTAAPLDNLLLWGGPGDMAEFVDKLERRTLDESTEASARAQKRISDDHTYDARAAQVLAFINELAAAKALAALQDPYGSCQRSGCLRVAVVWDAGHLGTSPEFATSFLAAADLLKRDYALGWHDARAAETSAQLLAYDVVVAVGGLGGAADAVVSRLTRDYTTFRRVTQRRVLVLFDEPRAVDDAAALSAGRDARPPEAVYDAACYAAEHDRRRLEALGFAPLGLQHAYGVSLPPPSGDDVVVDARGLVLARDVNDVDLIVLAARAALDGGADRVVVALIAEIVRVSQISRLRRRLRAEFEGRPVLLRLLGLDGVAAVADMVRRANVIMIVAAEPTGVPDGRAFTTGGGEWGLVVAARYMQADARLGTVPHNERLIELPADLGSLDAEQYAKSLSMAMCRALTLGRAAATIEIRAPHNGTVATGSDVEFDVRIDAFTVGRDGSWCLVVGLNRIVACPLQPQLRVVLRVAPAACDATVLFRAELKSNIYADSLRRSNTVSLDLRASATVQHAPRDYQITDALVVDYNVSCDNSVVLVTEGPE